jgi:hypothetical protein
MLNIFSHSITLLFGNSLCILIITLNFHLKKFISEVKLMINIIFVMFGEMKFMVKKTMFCSWNDDWIIYNILLN